MPRTNLMTRAISGAVFVALMLLCIWSSPWSMAALFLIVAIICQSELTRLNKDYLKGLNFLEWVLAIILYVAVVAGDLLYVDVDLLFVLLAIPAVLMMTELFRERQGWNTAAISFFNLIYGVLPFAFITRLAFINGTFQPEIVVGFFLLLWTNDTFAYLSGSLMGKHKLAASISPGKTWEGFFGGLLFAILVGWLISLWIIDIKSAHWIIAAVVVSVFGTIGDLIESSLKRRAGVKDSGNIMPGHGGLLDRFDGLLLSLPLVYLYFTYAL